MSNPMFILELRNSVLFARKGEEHVAPAVVDGYAIVPIEDYELRKGALSSEAIAAPSFPCDLCGAKGPSPDGHDPCIAKLPGVVAACCGHGKTEGYVLFEDGRVIRGAFEAVGNRRG